MSELGRTLFIVNPTAKNGKGIEMVALIESMASGVLDHEIALTTCESDAKRLAFSRTSFDTIVAVGGDGTAHDVGNGILERPADEQPAFSLIPYGSGNDYARTLGISSKPAEALTSLIYGRKTHVDVGRCNDEFFLESASFGVDAAIAIGTIELRKKNGGSGISLYLQSGFDVLRNHYETLLAHITDANAAPYDLQTVIFCVTIGQTYGGGFKIAPSADPCDGLLDICTADPISITKTLGIFLLATKGWHTGFKNMHLWKTSNITVDFDEAPPAQFDGEPRNGTHFELAVLPDALTVVVPQNSPIKTSF